MDILIVSNHICIDDSDDEYYLEAASDAIETDLAKSIKDIGFSVNEQDIDTQFELANKNIIPWVRSTIIDFIDKTNKEVGSPFSLYLDDIVAVTLNNNQCSIINKEKIINGRYLKKIKYITKDVIDSMEESGIDMDNAKELFLYVFLDVINAYKPVIAYIKKTGDTIEYI